LIRRLWPGEDETLQASGKTSARTMSDKIRGSCEAPEQRAGSCRNFCASDWMLCSFSVASDISINPECGGDITEKRRRLHYE
jgi:hypothetical protein